MNERIRELALQADGVVINKMMTGARQYTFLEDDLEKFAELIVQECADICNKIYFNRYPDAEDFERSEEGDAIKQHFGVRE